MKLKVPNFVAFALIALMVASVGSLIASVLNKGFDTGFSKWLGIFVFGILGVTLVGIAYYLLFVRRHEGKVAKMFSFVALLLAGGNIVVSLVLYGAGGFTVSDWMLLIRVVLLSMSTIMLLGFLVV